MKTIRLSLNLLLSALVAFAALWLPPRANAATNLVLNGGFQLPLLNAGGFASYAPGSTVLTNWTVDTSPDSDGVQLAAAGVINPNNGSQNLQLAGAVTYSQGGGISQTIATAPGEIYSISIDVAARSAAPSTGNFIWGGTNFIMTAPSTAAYTTRTFQVSATSSSTLIDITGTNGAGSRQFLIDNVVVKGQDTNFWGGFVDGNWDATTTNWGFGNSSFTDVKTGGFASANFADVNDLGNPVLNASLIIQASGVSIGTVNFLNNTVNYNLSDAGGSTTGITGATGVNKAGPGGVTIAGAQTYTGATTVSAGTLALGAGGSISNSAIINLASGTTLDASGAGTLYLGANQTLISAGNAPTNGAVIGNVDASTGGKIVPGGAGVVGQISFGNNLTLGGQTLTFDINTTTSIPDLISVTGNLTNNGTVTIAINPLLGTLAAGTYTLITYASLVGSGTFVLDSSTPRNVTLNVTPTAITVTVAGAAANLVWKGDGVANNWDLITSSNWLNGLTPAVFYQGDSVTFDTTGLFLPAINLTTTLKPGSITVGAVQNYVFGGPGRLSGIGGLTQNGPGVLVLDNAGSNDFSGGVNINGGALQIGTNDANGNLPSAPIVNNTSITFARTDTNLIVAGAISGGGAIIQNGTGSTTLSGGNSYSGGTVINAGTLQLNGQTSGGTGGITNNNAVLALSEGGGNTFNNLIVGTGTINMVGTGTGNYMQIGQPLDSFTGVINIGYNGVGRFVSRSANNNLGVGITVNITNNGQLYVQSGSTFGPINVAGPGDGEGGVGTFRMEGTAAGPMTLYSADVSISDNNAAGTISGPIGDGGLGYGLNHLSGTLTLSATNTYSGKTVNSGGTLILNTFGSISNSPVINLVSGSTFDVTAVSGGFSVNGSSGQTLNGAGTIRGNVNFPLGSKIAPGTNGSAGTLAFFNGLTLEGQTIQFDLGATPTSTTNDLIRVATGGNFEPLTLNADCQIALNYLAGSIAPGSYVLMTYPSLVGPGTFTLAQAYTNVTLTVGATATIITLGNGLPVQTWQGDGSGNNWDLTSVNWLSNGIPSIFAQSNNAVFTDAGSAAPSVNLATILQPSSIIMNAQQNYTFSGNGSLTGPMPLTLLSSGMLTIDSSNNYSGGTFIYFGALQLGNSDTNGIISGPITDNSQLILSHNNTNLLTNVISGSGQLIVSGSGREILSGSNSFSGGTFINGGTLQLNRANAAGSGTVALNNNVLNVLAGGFIFPNILNSSGVINVVPNVASPSTSVDFAQFSGTLNNLGSGTTINVPVGPGVARFETVTGNGAAGNVTINVTNGGQLYMLSGTLGAAVNLAGPGYGDAFGALRIDGGANLSGSVNLTANASVGNSTGVGTISGSIGDNNGGYGITVSAGSITYNGTFGLYHGNTTINTNASLVLTNQAAIENSPAINIGTNATFNVSGDGLPAYPIPSGLGGAATSQKLAGTARNGRINGSITLGSGGSLGVTIANDGKPSLIVTNGTLTLANNPVTVTASALPLVGGIYPLVSVVTNGTVGAVAGDVSTSPLSFAGAGLGTGASASLTISNSILYLVVNQPAPSPAVFSGASALPNNGGFQLVFSGSTGHDYVLLASTNIATPFTNWTTVATGSFGTQPVTNTDPATNFSRRFYIILSQ